MSRLTKRGFVRSWVLGVLTLITASPTALGEGTVAGWGGRVLLATPLEDARAIAAGQSHSLALKSDGTVVGWGANSDGLMAPPAGISGVVAIAAGGFFNLALQSDGTVVGWGASGFGQATPPAGLSGVVTIAAGYYHSLALIGSAPTPCLVDVSLSYSPGTLSITQTVGSTATSNVYQSALVTKFGVRQLVGPRSLPAIVPPRTFSFSLPLGSIGTVGVLGVLQRLDDSSVCYDFETVNTSAAGPSVEELKERLRRSGLAPKGF